MPRHNPKCRVCGGKTKFAGSAGLLPNGYGGLTEKAFYKCRDGHEFTDWAWKNRRKPAISKTNKSEGNK